MSIQSYHSHRTHSGSLLGWLGFGRGDRDADPDYAGDQATFRSGPAKDVRLLLLDEIGQFLVSNGLEITPANLATAHGAFSGLNPGLRRRMQRQRESGFKVTQSWLDQATATDSDPADEAVDQLVGKLERGIEDFTRTTRTARDATVQYGDALAQHVGKLESVPDAGALIADLADYARAMLERSRKAEADLRQSEEEAASLRRNLDRAQRDAQIDYLTGLPNRRAFEALLESEAAAANANGEPLCVAFCDIDKFKLVNDIHGHDAGDRILCIVARTLAEISDDKCHIARHGGEEFVLLFRGFGALEAMALLDGAREKLAARRLVNRRTEKPFGQITFSGGIADVFAHNNARLALAAADEALYQAKEGGRNRIILDSASG